MNKFCELKLVSNLPADKVKRDLVFVHGIQSSAGTWITPGTKGQPDIHLAEFLLPEGGVLEGTQSWVFDYPSSFLEAGSTPDHTQEQLGHLLLALLDQKNIGCQRPILFVAHSMGGLVVKHTLVTAAQREPAHPLPDKTVGIAFLGTPHFGASWATTSVWCVGLALSAVEKLRMVAVSRFHPSNCLTELGEGQALVELHSAFLEQQAGQQAGNSIPVWIAFEAKRERGMIMVVEESSGSGGDPDAVRVERSHTELTQVMADNTPLFLLQERLVAFVRHHRNRTAYEVQESARVRLILSMALFKESCDATEAFRIYDQRLEVPEQCRALRIMCSNMNGDPCDLSQSGPRNFAVLPGAIMGLVQHIKTIAGRVRVVIGGQSPQSLWIFLGRLLADVDPTVTVIDVLNTTRCNQTAAKPIDPSQRFMNVLSISQDPGAHELRLEHDMELPPSGDVAFIFLATNSAYGHDKATSFAGEHYGTVAVSCRTVLHPSTERGIVNAKDMPGVIASTARLADMFVKAAKDKGCRTVVVATSTVDVLNFTFGVFLEQAKRNHDVDLAVVILDLLPEYDSEGRFVPGSGAYVEAVPAQPAQ